MPSRKRSSVRLVLDDDEPTIVRPPASDRSRVSLRVVRDEELAGAAQPRRSSRLRVVGLWLGSALALATVAALTAATLSRPALTPVHSQRRLQPARVEIAVVVPTEFSRSSTFRGVTESRDRASLSFPIGGRLLELNVRVGDHVDRGQVLARVDTSAHVKSVGRGRTRSRLRQARRDASRLRRLVRSGAAARATLEQAELRVSVLASALRGQTSATQYTNRQGQLIAPFDGVVTTVASELGEVALPGHPIVTVSGTSHLELPLSLPERAIGSVRVGQQVDVILPLVTSAPIAGRVATVAQAAPVGGLFPVVVELEAADSVRPGMTGEITVAVGTSETAFRVPIQAVRDPAGAHPNVLIAKDDRAESVEVRILGLEGEHALASGNLQEGDWVIIAGHRFVVDGDPVQVD